MRSNFLMDLLSSIFERGERRYVSDDNRSIAALCAALLSERGEASGTRTAAALLDHYEALDFAGRAEFFSLLSETYDLDPDRLQKSAAAYQEDRSAANLEALLRDSEPGRQELLRRLNRLSGATDRLVRMRADLLDLLKENPGFRRTDLDFEHLFGSWFNRGFLVLRRIDWRTPAHILEKIIAYEAVHAIDSWDDLRSRLQPSDRRCFAFFHPAMPDEPLIFVEIALTKDIPTSIRSVLSENREHIDDREATTAVFYSISNCQRGLAGVSFGNFLIKQVGTDLSASLPNLKNFVTLSPVPGFTQWLRARADDESADSDDERSQIIELLSGAKPQGIAASRERIEKFAAEYLVTAKRRDGQPLDPVARFHLGNGARLERLNPEADPSPKAMSESLGLMVNYLYDLNRVEANHEAYAADREVVTTKAIRALAAGRNAARRTRNPENA
jgi:malonyl-CoA decarboxylase